MKSLQANGVRKKDWTSFWVLLAFFTVVGLVIFGIIVEIAKAWLWIKLAFFT
jgi:hypothetical protein